MLEIPLVDQPLDLFPGGMEQYHGGALFDGKKHVPIGHPEYVK